MNCLRKRVDLCLGLFLLSKISDGRNDYDGWGKAEQWQINGRKMEGNKAGITK